MKANVAQAAAAVTRLWGGQYISRYRTEISADFLSYEQVDQLPELGRELADTLAAEGLEIGGFLRTNQGEFFAAVVERVSSRPLAADEKLIVDVLTEASQLIGLVVIALGSE